jgi:hypothetical protein
VVFPRFFSTYGPIVSNLLSSHSFGRSSKSSNKDTAEATTSWIRQTRSEHYREVLDQSSSKSLTGNTLEFRTYESGNSFHDQHNVPVRPGNDLDPKSGTEEAIQMPRTEQ